MNQWHQVQGTISGFETDISSHLATPTSTVTSWIPTPRPMGTCPCKKFLAQFILQPRSSLPSWLPQVLPRAPSRARHSHSFPPSFTSAIQIDVCTDDVVGRRTASALEEYIFITFKSCKSHSPNNCSTKTQSRDWSWNLPLRTGFRLPRLTRLLTPPVTAADYAGGRPGP